MDLNGFGNSELSAARLQQQRQPVRKRPGPASKTMPHLIKSKKVTEETKPVNNLTINSNGTSTATSSARLNGSRCDSPMPSTSSQSNPPRNGVSPVQVQVRNPMFSPSVNSIASNSTSQESAAITQRIIIRKTECLLCSDTVKIFNVGDAESQTASLDKYKTIKTLCNYLSMNPMDVPHQYSEEMFPFCKTCGKIVDQIAASDRTIQEEQQKISSSILAIERAVADSELLRSLPNPYASEDQRCVKLRETVLEGYRNKLIMKKKIRESLLVGRNVIDLDQPKFPHTSVMVDENLKNQLKEATDTSAPFKPTDEEEEAAIGNIHIKNVMSMSTNGAVYAAHPPFDREILHLEESSDSVSCNSEMDVDVEEIEHPSQNYHEGNDFNTQVSLDAFATNGHSENQPSTSVNMMLNGNGLNTNETGENGPMSTADFASVGVVDIVIKQEIPSPPYEDSDVVRRRRSIFRGIDIFKVSSPGNQGCLECGVCGHSVLLSDNTSQISYSAYQSMTAHISDKHVKKGSSRTPSPPKRSPKKSTELLPGAGTSTGNKKPELLRCTSGKCRKMFKTFTELAQHVKEKHPSSPIASTSRMTLQASRKSATTASGSKQALTLYFECDICAKPMTCGTTNYLQHRFSHKNLKEKEQAILAREQGAPARRSINKFLRKTRAKTRKLSKINKDSRADNCDSQDHRQDGKTKGFPSRSSAINRTTNVNVKRVGMEMQSTSSSSSPVDFNVPNKVTLMKIRSEQDEENRRVLCNICGMGCEDNRDLIKHRLTHKNKTERKSEHTKSGGESIAFLVKRGQQKQDKEDEGTSTLIKVSISTKYCCPHCKRLIFSHRNFEIHKKACSLRVSRKKTERLSKPHPPPQKKKLDEKQQRCRFACSYCPLYYTLSQNLLRHMRTAHKIKPPKRGRGRQKKNTPEKVPTSKNISIRQVTFGLPRISLSRVQVPHPEC